MNGEFHRTVTCIMIKWDLIPEEWSIVVVHRSAISSVIGKLAISHIKISHTLWIIYAFKKSLKLNPNFGISGPKKQNQKFFICKDGHKNAFLTKLSQSPVIMTNIIFLSGTKLTAVHCLTKCDNECRTSESTSFPHFVNFSSNTIMSGTKHVGSCSPLVFESVYMWKVKGG